MKKLPVTQKVEKTHDYSLFKLLKGNRDIMPSHVRKIEGSIREKDAKLPIVVNARGEIIEGQHTFFARKLIGALIYYLVVENLGIADTQRLNSTSRNWIKTDYAKSFASEGLIDYDVYLKFRERWRFNHQISVMMLINSKMKTQMTFIHKEFKVKDLDLANQRAQEITTLGQFYKGYVRRSFVWAYYNLCKIDNFKFDILLRKFTKDSGSFFDQTNTENYTVALVNMYNKYIPKENKLPLNI